MLKLIVPKTFDENRKAYGDQLGEYAYCAQQIKTIDIGTTVSSPQQSSNDKRVRDQWQRGVNAWQAYLSTPHSVIIGMTENISTELASAAARYWIETGRPGEAIGALRQGIKAAKDSYAFPEGDMLGIQLALLYSGLGMHENARMQIQEIKAGGGVPKVQLDSAASANQAGVDAHFAQLFTQLSSGEENELDQAALRQEYAFFIRAEEGHRATVGSLAFRSISHGDARMKTNWMMSYIGKNLGVENHVRFFRAFIARKMLPEAKDVLSRLSDHLNTTFGAARYIHVLIPQLEAEFHLAQGDTQKALRLLDQAETAKAAQESGYTDADRFLYKTFFEQGLDLRKLSAGIREAAGQYDAAYKAYEEIIAWSERERASLPVDQRQFFFRSQAKDAYLGRIRCAARRWTKDGGSAAALDAVIAAAESMRSRQLLEVMRGDTHFSSTATTVPQLRMRLPKDGGLLQVIEAGNTAIVIWLDREAARVSLAPLPADWRQKIAELHAAAASGGDIDPVAASVVARVAFSGCDDRIAALTQLFAVLDGPLATIPLGILPYQGGYLADRLAVANLPSLSLWTGNRQITAAIMERSALLVADPLFNPARSLDRHLGGPEVMRSARGAAELAAFTPLPETRVEVQQIAKLFHDNKTALLLGRDAAESRLKGMDLQSFSLIHFATHGILGGEVPLLTEPALVLSYEDAEDGFLTASEVARLHLDADLVVLSACNTGSGAYIDGEGVNGLGRAFVIAGTRQVLMSLWPVDSAATVELMIAFYRHINRGVDAPQSLRLAQLEMRNSIEVKDLVQKSASTITTGNQTKDVALERGLKVNAKKKGYRSHPFYWAPFVLLTTN
jgi:CHAT domain-containing protein/tetratricopeptide (TPR) repeat protein